MKYYTKIEHEWQYLSWIKRFPNDYWTIDKDKVESVMHRIQRQGYCYFGAEKINNKPSVSWNGINGEWYKKNGYIELFWFEDYVKEAELCATQEK